MRPLYFFVKTVLVDIDQTIADWNRPVVCQILKMDIDQVYEAWPDDRWDMLDTLIEINPSLTKNSIWKKIDDAGAEFWANLPPLPWMEDLVGLCEANCRMVLLSKPSFHPSSIYGKMLWIQKHFGSKYQRYMLGPVKDIAANENSIIIDDSPYNCNMFKNSILFPSYGNKNRNLLSDPMDFVSKQLEIML